MYRHIEHFLKEALEGVFRKLLRLAYYDPHLSVQDKELISTVHRDGIALVENFLSKEECEVLAAELESSIEQNKDKLWVDETKSDTRLYNAQKFGEKLSNFLDNAFIERLRSAYVGRSKVDRLLLAAELKVVAGNLGSGGGWHRDSPHKTQFKAIVYLTDVDSSNGPFEYVLGSHTGSDNIRNVLKGWLQPNQYRFPDAQIELLKKNKEVLTVVGGAGTLVLVNTKGIHRGRPISNGRRLALTSYFFDGKMPADFLV